MKIACPNCHASYRLPDASCPEGQDTLKVRCKHCSADIYASGFKNRASRPLSTTAVRKGPPAASWFCAIDGRKVGPLTDLEVCRHIVARDLSAENLMWHAGFDSWLPVRDILPFAELASGLHTLALDALREAAVPWTAPVDVAPLTLGTPASAQAEPARGADEPPPVPDLAVDAAAAPFPQDLELLPVIPESALTLVEPEEAEAAVVAAQALAPPPTGQTADANRVWRDAKTPLPAAMRRIAARRRADPLRIARGTAWATSAVATVAGLTGAIAIWTAAPATPALVSVGPRAAPPAPVATAPKLVAVAAAPEVEVANTAHATALDFPTIARAAAKALPVAAQAAARPAVPRPAVASSAREPAAGGTADPRVFLVEAAATGTRGQALMANTVDDALNQKQVDAIAVRASWDVTRCYTRFADAGSGRESIVVAITLNADGTVASSKVRGKHASDAVGGCLPKAFTSLRFPATSGGVRTYTSRFIVGR